MFCPQLSEMPSGYPQAQAQAQAPEAVEVPVHGTGTDAWQNVMMSHNLDCNTALSSFNKASLSSMDVAS